MHMQLGNDVAKRSDVELVERTKLAQRSVDPMDFTEQLMLPSAIEVSQFDQTLQTWNQDQPGVASIVHQQNSAQVQIGYDETVASQTFVENERHH